MIRTEELQVAEGDRGRGMMLGEYESMQSIYAITPTFVPKPIAWGTFQSNDNLHFFLCDFHDMDLELPDVDRFTARLAELHRNSTSPNGKFGYHLTTYNGILPQDNTWTDSWEEYFSNNFKRMVELEEAAQGPPSEEQKLLVSSMLEKVIPRLLRPLETEGRRVKPCLIQCI